MIIFLCRYLCVKIRYLPWAKVISWDYEYAENVVLHLFEIKDGAEITTEVTDVSGKTVLVEMCIRDRYYYNVSNSSYYCFGLMEK